LCFRNDRLPFGMRRALIDPENSVFRNIIGSILFVPIVIISMVIALPFALFGRPSKRTATEVALYLQDFIEDAGSPYDWDDFISVPIANPQLDSIRARASRIDLPIDEEGLCKLRFLLSEVEEIAKNPHC